MNLHEYQAKKILKKFDLPILKGKHFNNLNINIDPVMNTKKLIAKFPKRIANG